MYKFRNPGTTLNTLTSNFFAFYNELKDYESFNLEEMARVLAQNKLMTSYGFSGDKALVRSHNSDVSRNSTQMNVKMYAEILRMLGWVASKNLSSSYPLEFTHLGIQVAHSNKYTVQKLYQESVLGIVNPNEILNVKYKENTRIFYSILNAISKMNGFIYKHEMCMIPMSYDDNDRMLTTKINECLLERETLSYSDFKKKFTEFSDSLGMKPSSVDNCTRMPIAMLKQCGFVCEAKNQIYMRKLSTLQITAKGSGILKNYENFFDLRLSHYDKYSADKKEAAIRLGYLSMLSRAGLDTSGYDDIVKSDNLALQNDIHSKELFFSPYQTIKSFEVNRTMSSLFEWKFKSAIKNQEKKVLLQDERSTTSISLNDKIVLKPIKKTTDFTDEVQDLHDKIISYYKQNGSSMKVVSILEQECASFKQNDYYPLIGLYLKLLGLNCHISRAGDNGARWDAIIIDNRLSIPIEIKSPTEEFHISLKAIRQALENKVILLSRRTYETTKTASSLVIGYKKPNSRSEMEELILAIKHVFDINIAVLDMYTLILLAVKKVISNQGISIIDLSALEGIVSLDDI